MLLLMLLDQVDTRHEWRGYRAIPGRREAGGGVSAADCRCLRSALQLAMPLTSHYLHYAKYPAHGRSDMEGGTSVGCTQARPAWQGCWRGRWTLPTAAVTERRPSGMRVASPLAAVPAVGVLLGFGWPCLVGACTERQKVLQAVPRRRGRGNGALQEERLSGPLRRG